LVLDYSVFGGSRESLGSKLISTSHEKSRAINSSALFLCLVSTQSDIEKIDMVAYEFYVRDPVKGNELIAVLPERRKDPERITLKSVMGWAEKVFRNISDKDIYFIQVTINEDTKSKSNNFSLYPDKGL